MPAVRPEWFDFQKPDYPRVFQLRIDRMQRIREATRDELAGGVPVERQTLHLLRSYYRDNPIQFVMDWGCTQDPRNPEIGLPTTMPFLLFDRQIEFADYILRKRRERAPGLCDKSRGVGASWICMALSCALCLFNDGLTIGFGSRKQEYVDVLDDPKSLFFKARAFMRLLPPEFRGGWQEKDAPFMRMVFRNTGSGIFGEAGDNIGRGGRTSIYFVDESAHLERPELVDAALSENTNVRIDLSSVKGMANPFATKRFAGKIEPFTFHWRSDPRKSEKWYADLKDVRGLSDVVIAQEYDIDYTASVEGVLIPSAWVQAAINAHKVLGIEPAGTYKAAMDVADQGDDDNALAGRHGVVLNRLVKWSGVGGDILASVSKVFRLCDEWGINKFDYDGIGVGSGVRGDARMLNSQRKEKGVSPIVATPWLASSEVRDPQRIDVPPMKNIDQFKNLNAQEWWMLRERFVRTHRWVKEGIPCDPSDIISLDPTGIAPDVFSQLCTELSQLTYDTDHADRIIIVKTPDGTKSPNLADSVMIVFAKGSAGLKINPKALGRK